MDAAMRSSAGVLLVALLVGCRSAAPVSVCESPPMQAATQVCRGIPATAPAALSGEAAGKKTEDASTRVSWESGANTDQDVQLAPYQANFAAESVPVSLSLDDAIATALAREPTLVTLRASEPVAHAAYHVAETYPFNPTIQVQVFPYAREKSGEQLGTKNSVAINQTLELAHQQRYREGSASAAWSQVRWNIVQAELTTIAQTMRLYFTALYQRDLRDLAERTAALDLELQGIVDRRFKAGLGTAAEQTMARVAARQSRQQAALADASYRAARMAIQRQLNLAPGEPFALVERLDDYRWLPVSSSESPEAFAGTVNCSSDDLVAMAAENRPDVSAARSAVAAARSNLSLARANIVQSPGVGPAYERDESGTLFFGVQTQVDLPLWNDGRPLAAQRYAELRQQLVTLDQLRARARVEAQTALDRYELARRAAQRGGTNASASKEGELRQIREQFSAGQADILNVFAVQNAILLETRGRFDLLNEVAQAAADVMLFTGIPPAQLAMRGPAPSPNAEAAPVP
jgi:outer membrane protein, heavy metal efflux system